MVPADKEHKPGRSSSARLTASKCKQCVRVFIARLFSHIGLCALVVGYAIVGALTFEALEGKHEIAKRRMLHVKRETCLDEMWAITDKFNVLYRKNWTKEVGVRLRQFEQEVVTAVKVEGYDGKEVSDVEIQWSFSGALLYSVTVITTIGYGNISPKTDEGKVVTILYALLGIPLMLLCLTNIGDCFAHAFKFAYSRVCCVLCRKRQPHSKRIRTSITHIKYIHTPSASPTHKMPQSVALTLADVTMEGSETESCQSGGASQAIKPPPYRPASLNVPNPVVSSREIPGNSEEPVQPTDNQVMIVEDNLEPSMRDVNYDNPRVPIYLVLGLVAGYVCIGAGIFSTWEKWSFLNGAYFCFITLSTIGFGDLVPGTSILHTDTQTGQAQLIICCFYLVLGLSIIAMSFNLVQEEVITKCKNIARNLGIIKDEDDDE